MERGEGKDARGLPFHPDGTTECHRKDSLHLTQIRESLRMQEQETNFLFLKEQGNNTLGTFMRKMVRGSLTEEQQKLLDEQGNTLNGERQESALWRCSFFSSGYCPIICSIGSRHNSFCLPPNHWPGICGIRRLWHVCQEISSLNSFITKGVVRP